MASKFYYDTRYDFYTRGAGFHGYPTSIYINGLEAEEGALTSFGGDYTICN